MPLPPSLPSATIQECFRASEMPYGKLCDALSVFVCTTGKKAVSEK